MGKQINDQNTWNEMFLDLEQSMSDVQSENKKLKESTLDTLDKLKKQLEDKRIIILSAYSYSELLRNDMYKYGWVHSLDYAIKLVKQHIEEIKL